MGGGGSYKKNSQSSQHVAGRDAVDADAAVSPLHGERGGHVADGSFGAVVRPVVDGRRWVSKESLKEHG